MKFLRSTLPTIAENLALDEALLESADHSAAGQEVLRIWQAESTFIVLGRSSQVDLEVNRRAAESMGVPIFRRVSGGTAIAAGRGCMFYSLLLDLEQSPHLRMLDVAHRHVMSKMLSGIQPLRPEIRFEGTCDLVMGDRKVSGNSLRVGRRWMLYHGTLLLNMDLNLISHLLRHPPREPDYRAGRNHDSFLANLDVAAVPLIEALQASWAARERLEVTPDCIVKRLVAEKYSLATWNYQR